MKSFVRLVQVKSGIFILLYILKMRMMLTNDITIAIFFKKDILKYLFTILNFGIVFFF